MSCNIVINQQSSLSPEAKIKDPDMQRRGKTLHERYMKKLKERSLKGNQEVQMTLKEFIEYFHHDLNDPASTLMSIEETTMRIMKEEYNTEINISIDHVENVQSKFQRSPFISIASDFFEDMMTALSEYIWLT